MAFVSLTYFAFSLKKPFNYSMTSQPFDDVISYLQFVYFFPVPPTSIEIIGHRSGSRIDVREHEELELKCRVSNSKPKANIIWYRKDSRYVTGRIYLLSVQLMTWPLGLTRNNVSVLQLLSLNHTISDKSVNGYILSA